MRTIFIYITILLLAAGCREESSSCHFQLVFNNNYDKNTYVTFGSGYPDTIVALRLMYGKMANGEYTQAGQSNSSPLSHPRRNCLEDIFRRERDTLMYFVIDAYIFENNSWQTIIDNYLILQRYDLTVADMNLLHWSLPFPPTEEMRHMKMYPPYGTYNK
jgi:hypothetical protein